MELPEVGAHCDAPSCNQVDFLPFKCECCLRTFCKNHNSQDRHDCSNGSVAIEKEMKDVKELFFKCSFADCSDSSMSSEILCPSCCRNFCLSHRHEGDHNCPEYRPVKNPMAEADAKIKKLTENLSRGPVRRKRHSALADKVALMKLKGIAVGPEKLVPPEERVFFSVLHPSAPKDANPLAVFVSRRWTLGRALDLIAEYAKVENRNNSGQFPRLELFRQRDGLLLEPLSAVVEALLSAGEIGDGEHLVLAAVPAHVRSLQELQ